MKTRRFLLLFIFGLTACSSRSLPTPISTAIQTRTPLPSVTSTIVPTQTATIVPSPTSTRVPPDPKNISYKVLGDVPQFEVDSYLRGLAIMQGYLCAEYQICDFKPTTLLIGDTGRGCGSDDTVGGTLIYMHVQDCGVVDPTEFQLIGGTAGESAIAYAVQQQGCMTNTGGSLNLPATWFDGGGAWLREHALIWAGEIPPSWKEGLTPEESAYRMYIRESPKWDANQIRYMDLGADNDRGNWWHRIVVGYVMFEYLDQHPELITVPPQDSEPTLLLTRLCKAVLKTGSLDAAFKIIGIDRQDLYARVAEHMVAECARPDIRCNNGPLSGTTGISGKIFWDAAYGHQDFGEYILNFCPIVDGNCYGGTSVKADGTFFQSLYPGDYLISLNSVEAIQTGGSPTGWYSINGMVEENTCGGIVHVDDQKITTLTFMAGSPHPCPSSFNDIQTPQPTGISGKIIWSASYPHQDIGQYTLSFCPTKGGDCVENISMQSNGTFLQLLPSGYYVISLNQKGGDIPVGWYSKSGMVTENVCGDSIYVGENKTVKIDFYIITPTQCP